MKTIRISLVATALLALALTGCSPDDPTHPEATVIQPEGPAALARYVAIGNSLTAGFMDGGLSMIGQLSSYPAQIAMPPGRLARCRGRPLVRPAADPARHRHDRPGRRRPTAGVLHWDGAAITVLDETPLVDLQTELLLASSYPTPYHNLGVPGATTLDVTDALNSGTSQSPGNSYFDFILRNPTFGDVNMLEPGHRPGADPGDRLDRQQRRAAAAPPAASPCSASTSRRRRWPTPSWRTS